MTDARPPGQGRLAAATPSGSDRRALSARAQRRPWSFRHLRSWIAARRSFLSTTPARARAWRGQAARSGAKRREQRPGEAGTQYLVDGQDRRVGKKKNGVLERAWLYRNQLNPVAELDGSGALVARFVYGSKTNVPEYMVRGGATYRVLSDHLGSPRALVDVASGTVAWRADFDAWGKRTLTAGTADFLPFGFAGGMFDPETGLTRFGARDYDPVVGRWTAKDPSRFSAGSGLYAYSWNDPVNFVDATGRSPWPAWLFDLDDLHRNRNKYNRCPEYEPKAPSPNSCSPNPPDSRRWKQDFWGSKWRADDGAECSYDDAGRLVPDGASFNFCPNPFTPCHVFADFLPALVLGGSYTKTGN